jgi:hypothetical protein
MKKLFTVVIIAVFALLVFPFKSFAQETVAKNFTLDKGTIVTHNPYFAYGENVTVSGTVNGDTYVAGGNILIDGNINGDLLVVGGNIEILGNVKEDVRIIGGQVTIKGKVGKNVSVAGGNIKIGDTAVVTGSFVAAGGNIEILGPINDNIDIAGGNITLNSKVAKAFDVIAEQITLGEKASILGKFEYWSNNNPEIAQAAVVKGQVIKHPLPAYLESKKGDWENFKAEADKAETGGRVIGTLSLLLIGMLFVKFAKKFMLRSSEIIHNSFWKSMGIGFLVVILTPLLFITLLITVIGAPIALVIMAMYLVMLYLVKIFVIFSLGTKILPNKSPYLAYLLGLVIYALVVAIPWLGDFTNFIVLLVGMGAMISFKQETFAEYSK